MTEPTAPMAGARSCWFESARSSRVAHLLAPTVIGIAFLAVAAVWLRSRPHPAPEGQVAIPAAGSRIEEAETQPGSVRMGPEKQEAIGLRTVPIKSEPSLNVLTAPGQVAPNESQYAYITPRAAGVVRTVLAHVGQDVKAGDLLATIDSPEVGAARLELYTRLQTLEVAHSQADWQRTVYRNTLDLIDLLRQGKTPEEIHRALEDRPVGQNRERLMTAYAQFRLATATIERNRDLYTQQLITTKQFQQVKADYEVAEATYHSLMDQIGYEVRLANTRAQQALKQAETAVRAAQEHLRILGVRPDGTEPEVARGKVVGVKPDGTLADTKKAAEPEATPEKIIPPEKGRASAVEPVGAAHVEGTHPKDAPVSTYSIWAPFDGTILDREMIVPGVAVDTTRRIFTLANLSTVWVEASVHENDFPMLAKTPGGKVVLRSPAYPGREFEGHVIYAGDMVDEKTRAIKLLAQADNPGRLLKPGMFVEVEVVSPGGGTVARIPASAIQTEGSRTYVYVRRGPDLFLRREVVAEPPRGDKVSIVEGLEPGDEVVVEGGYKLRSLEIQMTSSAG